MALAILCWPAGLHRIAWAHDIASGVARYNTDGSADKTFNASGQIANRNQDQTFANALAIQPDDKIVAVGATSNISTGVVGFSIVRYTPDGSPDATFGVAGAATTQIAGLDAEAHAVAVQADGKIVVAGTAFGSGGTRDQFALARFNVDGTLDPGFASTGVTTTSVGLGSAEARGIALQGDGKIVVAGTAFDNGPTEYDFGLARYNPDGSLDAGFGSGGVTTIDFSVVEGGPDASLDRGNGVALQADGKILIVGAAGGRFADFAVARCNADGTPDVNFGTSGRAIARITGGAEAHALALQADGGIVIAGSSHSRSGGASFALARFKSDGTLDAAFGSGGFATADFEGGSAGARAVVIQSDGLIVVGGSGYGPTLVGGDGQEVQNGGFALVRYRADGSLDTTFGSGGRVLTTLGDAGAIVNGLGLQQDERIVAAGLVNFRVLNANVDLIAKRDRDR